MNLLIAILREVKWPVTLLLAVMYFTSLSEASADMRNMIIRLQSEDIVTLVGNLVWPTVAFFALIKFGAPLSDLLYRIHEITVGEKFKLAALRTIERNTDKFKNIDAFTRVMKKKADEEINKLFVENGRL